MQSNPRVITEQKNKQLSKIRSLFETSIALQQQVMEIHLDVIVEIAEAICQSLRQGSKILLCGNGGSANQAQHIATELLVRLRPQINRQGLSALALAADASSLTAYSNDYDFDTYFERMTCTLGRPGDILIGITTSGKSKNVIQALKAARKLKMVTIGMLGGDGHPALTECDLALVVPSMVPGRIQEAHLTVGHAVVELVEDMLLESGYLTCE